jgi:hypothetical protein
VLIAIFEPQQPPTTNRLWKNTATAAATSTLVPGGKSVPMDDVATPSSSSSSSSSWFDQAYALSQLVTVVGLYPTSRFCNLAIIPRFRFAMSMRYSSSPFFDVAVGQRALNERKYDKRLFSFRKHKS